KLPLPELESDEPVSSGPIAVTSDEPPCSESASGVGVPRLIAVAGADESGTTSVGSTGPIGIATSGEVTSLPMKPPAVGVEGSGVAVDEGPAPPPPAPLDTTEEALPASGSRFAGSVLAP